MGTMAQDIATRSAKVAHDIANLEFSPEVKAAMARYLPYLEELQKKLLQVVIVMLGATILGAIYHRQILTFVLQRFDLTGINMVISSPYQVIELAIQTGIYVGILTAFPLLVYHLLTFLKPALEAEEYKVLVSLIPVSLGLFIGGFTFGVWVMNFIIALFAKATLDYSIGNIWDISMFFSQILFSAVSLGLVFQFPILITILLRFKVLPRQFFTEKRPFMYAAALIFAAMLPPTDIFSLILLVIPLFVLFEATLLLNRVN